MMAKSDHHCTALLTSSISNPFIGYKCFLRFATIRVPHWNWTTINGLLKTIHLQTEYVRRLKEGFKKWDSYTFVHSHSY